MVFNLFIKFIKVIYLGLSSLLLTTTLSIFTFDPSAKWYFIVKKVMTVANLPISLIPYYLYDTDIFLDIILSFAPSKTYQLYTLIISFWFMTVILGYFQWFKFIPYLKKKYKANAREKTFVKEATEMAKAIKLKKESIAMAKTQETHDNKQNEKSEPEIE